MKRMFMLATAAVLVLLVGAVPALAGPEIQDLTSPTHPSQGYPYYDRDVTLTWSAASGPAGSCSLPGYANGLAVDGGYAYVAADWMGGLQVVDVGSAAAPAAVASCLEQQWLAYDVAVSAGYAYLSYWNGLQIVDVTDPAAPLPLGSCTTPDWAMDVVLDGSYAYVPSDTAGLQIIDVTAPDAPFVAGACWTGGNARGVDLVGDYALVANGWSGLQVVDVSDPTDPALRATLDMSCFAHQVKVEGDYAYVAGGSGLHVVDVHDPLTPMLVGSCSTSSEALAVVLFGARAFVATGYAGVREVDIADPTSPVIVRTFATPGSARGLAADGQYVYVADQEGGLQILDPLDTEEEFAYSFCLDQEYGGEPDDTIDAIGDPSAPGTSYSGLESGTWFFHVKACDGSGDWGFTQTFQITIDHAPRIENLWSPTNPPWSWSTCNDPAFVWSAVPADGCTFSYSVDADPYGSPDTVADPVSDPANPSVTLTDVADGHRYFHVRACDSEGNWGQAATFELYIDTTGPVTLALSYKTAKSGAIWLQYSVSDNVSSSCYVTIEVTTSAGRLVSTMDIGWRQCDTSFTAVLPLTLKKGSYRYTVHATDWLGNPESKAGSASFVVR